MPPQIGARVVRDANDDDDDVVYGGGSVGAAGHTQRLQLSDGSRLESPTQLPRGHAYV